MPPLSLSWPYFTDVPCPARLNHRIGIVINVQGPKREHKTLLRYLLFLQNSHFFERARQDSNLRRAD